MHAFSARWSEHAAAPLVTLASKIIVRECDRQVISCLLAQDPVWTQKVSWMGVAVIATHLHLLTGLLQGHNIVFCGGKPHHHPTCSPGSRNLLWGGGVGVKIFVRTSFRSFRYGASHAAYVIIKRKRVGGEGGGISYAMGVWPPPPPPPPPPPQRLCWIRGCPLAGNRVMAKWVQGSLRAQCAV